ncbi:MAG: magnesium transporter CorA family protein [Pseudomonadales bacterium]|nr:magnesium transporter CorA family protein [Candidatus Woesebacteria bacterium]MCB9802254.1 magnesium transporter CorA family protein [Pseudomonadales bacterium]
MRIIFYKNKLSKNYRLLTGPKVGAWIHTSEPSKKELLQLATEFALETPILSDALDPFEIPRIELDEETTYLITRFPRFIGDTIRTAPLLLIRTPAHVLTVSPEKLDRVTTLLEQNKAIYTTQKSRLIINILLEIDNEYEAIIHTRAKQVLTLSKNFTSLSDSDIESLVLLESTFNELLFSLEPISLMLEQLMSGKYLKLYEHDADLLEDLLQNNNQLIRMCETHIKGIINIRDSYTTIATNRLNKNMKLLTVMTAILTVPTMIASFFGMNVVLPFAQHSSSFIAIGLLAVSLTGLLVFLLKKRDVL